MVNLHYKVSWIVLISDDLTIIGYYQQINQLLFSRQEEGYIEIQKYSQKMEGKTLCAWS